MIKLNGPSIGKEEIKAVEAVLLSKHLERGDKTIEFEKTAAKYFGAEASVLVCNGTAALQASLMALGVSQGDEVITTSLSFVATANSILMCGAKPVFVDIDADTFNIDPKLIEAKINKRTKAILTVDLYGRPADYEAIFKIAKKHRIPIVADSCQAAGAEYKGKMLTKWADVVVLSFFSSKNIMCGEGGLVLSNRDEVIQKVNSLINHGQKRGEKYNILSFGYNFRPTEMQAAVLLVQIKKLKKINERRIENAKFLIDKLKKIKGIKVPTMVLGTKPVFNRFVIRVTKDFCITREEFQKVLIDKYGIESEVVYPKALFEYEHLNISNSKDKYFVVKTAVKEVLSLPIHQNLSKKDLEYMVKSIKDISG